MVVPIGDDELPDSVDCDAGQAVKLAVAVAICAKLTHVGSVRIEDLDAVIAAVSHSDEIVGPDGNSAGPSKFTVFAPSATYL